MPIREDLFGAVQDEWAHYPVIFGGMMLGAEVAQIGFTWFPVDIEVFLCFAVFEPVVFHVH